MKRVCKSTHSKAMQEYLTDNQITRCELCGMKKGLEVHHILPRVCGGDDSYDNMIAVCVKCHALLTPRRLLTKIGMFEDSVGVRFHDFWKKIDDMIGDSDDPCAVSVAEILDEVLALQKSFEGGMKWEEE